MRRLPAAIVLSCLLVLTGACRGNQSRDSKAPPAGGYHVVAPLRKEIIAPNVLAAQLAAHDEFEGKDVFGPNEVIQASLFLASSGYFEQRRIVGFLISDDVVIEEQTIAVAAGDRREQFDFVFARTPRLMGCYQIRLVE